MRPTGADSLAPDCPGYGEPSGTTLETDTPPALRVEPNEIKRMPLRDSFRYPQFPPQWWRNSVRESAASSLHGQFSGGQIRMLQRRTKLWRVTEGPAREVYFGQVHVPGRRCASGFTHIERAGNHAGRADVRTSGVPLRADVFELGDGHDLLFREFGEPQRGWQNAVWELGAVAAEHRTDNLSASFTEHSSILQATLSLR
jgi:hypothetical protein